MIDLVVWRAVRVIPKGEAIMLSERCFYLSSDRRIPGKLQECIERSSDAWQVGQLKVPFIIVRMGNVW